MDGERGMDGGDRDISQAFPLGLAREGDRVRIVALRGAPAFVRRITALGLNIGADLVVSQNEGARLVLVRGDMRLGLGAGAAHRIMVTPST
mgnify:CR=1 FL=1